MLPLGVGGSPRGQRAALLRLWGVYSPTHYYMRVSRGGELFRHSAFFTSVGVLGTGVPRLACLRPAAWLKGGQHGPSSSTQAQDPREGPSLAGRTTRSFLRHGLVRLAHEEAESSRRGTSRGAHDASHDDQGRQSGASPRSVLLSSLVQREQAQARASSKGIHFGATRPRPSNDRKEVIVEPKPASPPEPLTGEDQL